MFLSLFYCANRKLPTIDSTQVAQNDLPPKYYLEYFNYVLDFVQEKYRHILNENEWRFLRKYYCLSEDAQCLFIRFSNRRGLFFRTNKLTYNELTDIPVLLNELLEREFIEKLNPEKHQTFSKEMLNVLNAKEIIGRFSESPKEKLVQYTDSRITYEAGYSTRLFLRRNHCKTQ